MEHYRATDSAGLRVLTDAFVAAIDAATGLYHDCTQGFAQNLKQLEEGQQRSLAGFMKSDPALATGEHVDSLGYSYGKGDPNDPGNVLFYWSTQGEFKARHQPGGTNHKLITQFCLVLVFAYWEEQFRRPITMALGLVPEAWTEPIMGDLRLLRNDIIHNRGVVTDKTATRLEVIQGLSQGQEILFDDEGFHSIIREVKAFLDRVVTKATGDDPQYRTIWHIR